MYKLSFKHDNNNEIYKLQLKNDGKVAVAIDGYNYRFKLKNDGVSYKINIISSIKEPLTKTEKKYTFEQNIKSECDDFFNYLLDSNIFDIVDDYNKYMFNDTQTDNKFVSYLNKLIEYRDKRQQLYQKYRIHYKIYIEILTTTIFDINIYYHNTIKNTILNDIIENWGICCLFSDETCIRNLYKPTKEFLNAHQIREVIDEIIFNINGKEYQYEDVTNNNFIYNFDNNYDDIIFITTNYMTLNYNNDNKSTQNFNKTNINNTYYYLIYKSKRYNLRNIKINGKYILVMEDRDKKENNMVFKQNFVPISLNVYQGKDIITILYDNFKDWQSWKYQYFNDVDLYQLDIDPRIEQALKLLYTCMFGDDVDDLSCSIWSYERKRSHRKNIYDNPTDDLDY